MSQKLKFVTISFINYHSVMKVAATVLSVFLFMSSAGSFPGPHSGGGGSTSQINVSWDGAAPTINTVIQSLLQVNTPVTYELNVPQTGDKFLLEITLDQFWYEYEVKKDYNFTLPTLDVTCTCDCPGGHDLCNLQHEESSSCDSDHDKKPNVKCFKKYSSGHQSSGCFLASDVAELCCNAALHSETKPDNVYHALYLSSPKNYHHLKTRLLTKDGKVIDPILCEHEKNPLCETTFDVSLPSMSSLPFSEWTYVDPKTKKLMANGKINDVDEHRPDKLGWFKVTRSNEITTVSENVARNALDVYTTNCYDDDFSWKFNAIGWNGNAKSAVERDSDAFGSPIDEFYKSTIAKVEIAANRRSVKVYPQSTNIPKIPFQAVMKIPVGIIFHFKTGKFGKFSPIIELDEFTNNILKLDIEDAFGELFLSVGDGKQCEIFRDSFTVSTKQKFSKKEIRIPHCSCLSRLVCLSTANNASYHCQLAQCKEKLSPGARLRDDDFYSGNGPAITKINKWYQSVLDWINNVGNTFTAFKWALACVLVIAICFILRYVIKNSVSIINCFCGKNRRSKDQVDACDGAVGSKEVLLSNETDSGEKENSSDA